MSQDTTLLDPPVSQRETLELVRLAQAGDRAALERLFERYYPRVLALVRLRVGAELRQRVASVDVLHETFALAARILPRLRMRSEASLVAWSSKLAEHAVRGSPRAPRGPVTAARHGRLDASLATRNDGYFG